MPLFRTFWLTGLARILTGMLLAAVLLSLSGPGAAHAHDPLSQVVAETPGVMPQGVVAGAAMHSGGHCVAGVDCPKSLSLIARVQEPVGGPQNRAPHQTNLVNSSWSGALDPPPPRVLSVIALR